jgi:hypothetical protein
MVALMKRLTEQDIVDQVARRARRILITKIVVFILAIIFFLVWWRTR